MLTIKILGAGCPNCKRLEAETRAALDKTDIKYNLEKITEYPEIMAYNILQTPALVINEQVVSVGRIPKRQQILEWVQSAN